MTLLKNDPPVGIPNLLGAFSSVNRHRSGDTPNLFGAPVLRSVGPSHNTTFFNKVIDTLTTLILETVARGERVTLRDLGYFNSREWKGRTVENKLLGDTFSIPSHQVPTFYPSSKFRKAVRQ